MKKWMIAFCFLLCLGHQSFSQSCEEREVKLLSVMGTLSAGFLYNTYGLIGSIADGYEHNVYNEIKATDLVNAQQKLADNMTILLEQTIVANTFKAETDLLYIRSSVAIIKGLKMQAQYLVELMRNDSQKNRKAYDEQRKQNWKDLSKLMGVPE